MTAIAMADRNMITACSFFLSVSNRAFGGGIVVAPVASMYLVTQCLSNFSLQLIGCQKWWGILMTKTLTVILD